MANTLQKARRHMSERGMDVLVASSPENVAYLAGTSPPSQRIVRSRHAFFVVPMSGPTHYVVIQLEAGLVRKKARADEIRVYREFVEDPIDVVVDLVTSIGGASGRMGIEDTHLSARDADRLHRMLPRAELVPVDDMLLELRLTKTSAEIETIRSIGRVAERSAVTAVSEASTGWTERQLGNRVAELYAQGGGDQLTMLVVGSGGRSAEPNAPPSNRTIGPGDVVRIDVIGTMDNYYSDVARTAVVGPPTDEQRKIWALLRDVRERALDAMRPGVLTSDVYRLYEQLMHDAGLPTYHFLGHGLGVTLHEEPFLSSMHKMQLQEGMVMCVEPLCLLEGRFGLQLEDEVLITADGCEPITDGGPLLQLGG